MLHSAVVFFVIALASAVLGFGSLAEGAVGIAQTLFVSFGVLAVGSYVSGVVRGR